MRAAESTWGQVPACPNFRNSLWLTEEPRLPQQRDGTHTGPGGKAPRTLKLNDTRKEKLSLGWIYSNVKGALSVGPEQVQKEARAVSTLILEGSKLN